MTRPMLLACLLLVLVSSVLAGMGIQELRASTATNPCFPRTVQQSYWDDAVPDGWHTQLRDYQCSDGRVIFVRQP